MASQEPIGHIYRLDGNVISVNIYQEEKGEYLPKESDIIYEKDIVTVGALSSAEIVLSGKALVKLGPETVFEFKKHSLKGYKKASLFKLVSGNVIINPQITEESAYRYEIDKANISVVAENSEVAMQYNNKEETTTVACLDGHAQVILLHPGTAEPYYEKEIAAGEYLQITKNNGASKVAKISEPSRQNILDSFKPNKDANKTWEFPYESPFHFARFSTGFRYYVHKIADTVLYSSEIDYMPLFHLHSGLYLEPYLNLSFASANLNRIFYQTGMHFEYRFGYGIYAGAGMGFG